MSTLVSIYLKKPEAFTKQHVIVIETGFLKCTIVPNLPDEFWQKTRVGSLDCNEVDEWHEPLEHDKLGTGGTKEKLQECQEQFTKELKFNANKKKFVNKKTVFEFFAGWLSKSVSFTKHYTDIILGRKQPLN